MQLRASLADRSPYRKFLIIVGLTLIGAVLSSSFAMALVRLLYGIDTGALLQPGMLSASPNSVAALRMFQGISALGTFIFPAWMAAWFFSDDSLDYLGLVRGFHPTAGLLVFLLLLVGLPVINWMMELNAGLHLPAFMESLEHWMKTSEQQAERLTEALLSGTTVVDLLANLLVIALIPAIGEEIMFRGLLQRQFTELARNRHMGIVLTAVLFSAMHMQFFGFLPRFVLGLLLGYLYLWSRSLWLPVAAHFFNNAAAVLMTFLHKRNSLGFDPDTFGTGEGERIIPLISGIGVVLMMGVLYRMLTRMRKSPE